MFTEYKFSPAQISEAARVAANTLASVKPGVNAPQFAAQTMADRLMAKPETYLQYGPYWWAVKDTLRALGHDFGPADDAIIRAEFGGSLPAYGRLVAGEQFRSYYLSTFLAGSAQFWLDADGEESYVLFDADIEARRLGKGSLKVSANLNSTPEPDAPAVLDAVVVNAVESADQRRADASQTPFAIDYEFEGALWQADVFATDFAHAEAKLKALQATGKLGGAVDVIKGIAQPLLDSATAPSQIYVDLKQRRIVVWENGVSTGAQS